jgi:hypothetical protein
VETLQAFGALFQIPIIILNFCIVNQKCHVLSRAINFGRQCHFKIWLDCHKLKKNPCLIMPKVSKKMRKKLQLMSYDMMIGYDIYDCFTMEHFRLRQRMTLTIKM